jgi:tetratricopeptide (TPR) repeat protein/tRNA A-37 threonylcarbamoyl transferase component Bud32/TolB-like protein
MTAATAFNVTCPKCGERLRFALAEESPARLRIQCSACQAVFGVRRPGADPGLPLPTGPPTLTGTPIPPSSPLSGKAEAGPPTRLLPSRDDRSPGGSAQKARSLLPEEILAGRYRVIRFLARGGMGEVYEVADSVLGERVALKTVRPEVAADTTTVERFKREIQLARKVTHPNVCRIFDVSHHQPEVPAGSAPVIFLTMELLAGQTLAQRLQRGRLAPEEALPIARQVAAALNAAHAVGVVHRDLKPGNVLLVPVASGAGAAGADTGGVRAVVTDFGLARSQAEDVSLTLTSAAVLGTPAYIAPEQVAGGEITPAVDIYAFGIVLYEMVTGKLPFTADTALGIAVKRLTEPPIPPRTYLPGIDPRWESAILRCLERDPAHRFATTLEVVEALSGRSEVAAETGKVTKSDPEKLATAATAAAVPAGTRKRRRSLAALLLLVAVAGTVGAYRYHQWRERQQETRARLHLPEGPIVSRRSIAVLGFEDRSAPGAAGAAHDAAWLSPALAEMLSTELASGDELRVISGEEVARMKVELQLGEADSLARGTLTSIRHLLGSDYVVLGSYVALGSPRQIRLDLRLQDTAAGETTAAVAESGSETHLFDLVSRVGTRLRHALGAKRTSGSGSGPTRAALPASPEAARFYAEGLTRLRLFDPAGAKTLLAQAAAAEPGNALVHESLAAAWASLGYEEKARDEARRALDLSTNLPQEERLLIEGRYREATEDWPKAVEIYRSLWGLFPDNLDYGLRLAAAERSAGQPEEALGTAEALRTLPAPAAEDPRIDLAESAAAGALADFKRQQAAAARAAARGTAQGARLLVAQARLAECSAFRNLGHAEAALAACEAGRRLYADAGDRSGVAEALTHAANVLYDRGDLAGAEQRDQQALATYRELGNRGGEAGALNNIAVILKSQGQIEQARQLYEQVLGLTREIGSRSGEAYALNNLAAVLLRHGELGKARGLFEQSLKIRRELADRSGEAYALDNLGVVLRRQGELSAALARHGEALAIRREIGQKIGEVASLTHQGSALLDRGDLASARKCFEESLEISEKTGNQSAAANALFGLGEVLLRQGQVEEAARRHGEALAIRTRLGEMGSAAESRLALAALKLEQGDAEAADTLANQAALELGRQGVIDGQGLALAVAAQAAAARGDAGNAGNAGDIARALSTMDQAMALLAHGEDLGVRLEVAVRAARLAAATGKRHQATVALTAAHDDAQRAGLVEPRLQADLTLAEVAIAEGHTADGRARFAALATEARAKGYGLIARKIKGF